LSLTHASLADMDPAGAAALVRRVGAQRESTFPPTPVQLVWPGKRQESNRSTSPAGGVGRPGGASALESVLQVGDPSSGNLLVRGDNARVLATLLDFGDGVDATPLRGTVKLCYFDPPFNTGEKFGYYRDSLGAVHWLEALRERLVLASLLLHPQGSIWVHLDDGHQHHARCLLDEIFGPAAFVATIVWQRRTSRDNRTAFSASHDYIHVYAPMGAKGWKSVRNGLPDTGAFGNPDDDPRGPWRSVPMSAQAGHGTASQFYALRSPSGDLHEPPPGRCWTYTEARFEQLVSEGRVYWPRGGRGRPRLKRYAHEVVGLAPSTIWTADDVGDNALAKKELLQAFPRQDVFDTPKPERLLVRIIQIGSDPGDLVLDPYLGSGTTAAVAHKLRRRWIGIERENRTVVETALPRLKRVVAGTDDVGLTGEVNWSGGGGFRYATAHPLM
jgi:adenine-specific DNA-methyltransferase